MNLCHDFNVAVSLKDEMINKHKISPNVVTYNTLLEKVETEGNAIKWIIDFCSTNLIPNAITSNELDKVTPVLYESSELIKLFAIILRFNSIMFFKWLSNFEISKVDKFIAVFHEEANTTDFNKLGFANYYLQQKDCCKAKEFLDSVTEHKYYYFKYSGNYWFQSNDYLKAEENYNKALAQAENNFQRAKILDKLASLIKEFELSHEIDKAVKYCKESIFVQPDNSPEAKQLLTYFTIEFNSIDQISSKIDKLRHDFKIGKKTINEALKEISDEKKRDLIKNLL